MEILRSFLNNPWAYFAVFHRKHEDGNECEQGETCADTFVQHALPNRPVIIFASAVDGFIAWCVRRIIAICDCGRVYHDGRKVEICVLLNEDVLASKC